jgi:hypothetical protein
MTTLYRTPLPENRTQSDLLLAGIGNAWRRELLAFCATPKTLDDIKREFLLVNAHTQIVGTLQALSETGWLRQKGDSYVLNINAVGAAETRVALICGEWLAVGTEDDAAIDLALAALRRSSCCRVFSVMSDGVERSTTELRSLTGLTKRQIHYATSTWTSLGLFEETARPGVKEGSLYRQIKKPLLPALGGYLHRLQAGYGGQT